MKEVVFVTEIPRAREAKMSQAARLAGYSVSIIYQKEPNYSLKELFTNVHKADSSYDVVGHASQYKPVAFHCFSPTAHYACALLASLKPGKIVFEFTDLLEGMVLNSPVKTYEVNQRYCIENADAVVARDRQLDFAREKLGYRIPAKTILIPDMCWDNGADAPPRNDGEFHVVVAGNFGMESRGEGDWGYLEIAKALARNRVHFHIYPFFAWYNAAEERFRKVFADYLALEQTGYVHVHRSVGSDALVKELRQYDYGINVIWGMLSGQGMQSHSPDHVRLCGSARNTDYLDAGLPVLLSPELEFQKETLGGAAIPVTKDFLDNPRAVLEAMPLSERQMWCRARRSKLSVSNQADRLREFYESL